MKSFKNIKSFRFRNCLFSNENKYGLFSMLFNINHIGHWSNFGFFFELEHVPDSLPIRADRNNHRQNTACPSHKDASPMANS